MPLAENEQAEAIYIFSGNKIIREMLYSEFEAILDGYVPIPDFARKQVRAVYVRINSRLAIVAAVFFLIEFDAEGFPDRRWNIPLGQLADTASSGPDLGAGPIRLACASQCAIDWHQPKLWDPNLQTGRNNFSQLKKCASANRLGLIFKRDEKAIEQETIQQTAQQQTMEARLHMAQLIKDQRFKMSVLKNQYQQQVDSLKLEHQQRLGHYQLQLEAKNHELQRIQLANQQLKEKTEAQLEKMAGIREYFEHKLQSAQAGEQESLQSLQAQYQAEMQLKLDSATAELEEQVQLLNMELTYRNEQEASLNEEINRLKAELQNLMNNSGNELLSQLQEQGINFVSYQPGAGHITIPVSDLADFMESPEEYAARKIGLSGTQYRNWLAHYHKPNCCALKSDGSVCGAVIERVHNPRDFHPGENDRCADHRAPVTQTFAVLS
ncbi:hypothetical protein [Simiduia agarivorans]|uniref:Chromosome segregation ATPase n=1 Tax=Simiduia agarivorans (strain DSM 21679 / JCM 13881 / BCRC 17597 / SA1) TaxID=1117647 RepID=K4KHI4_SIMAS|nr:hypothetical protein [Simiduia agarivorans]AFU97418.1 hypothetical protein M5M_00925 [Simiduia agarivorans SA1 = DSM 21679]